MSSSQAKLAPGGRLPDIALPSSTGESTVPLKPGGRRNPVIVYLHAECDECRAYVERLSGADAELREWDAHVVIVVPSAEDAAKFRRANAFPVAVDAEGVFAARTGIAGAAVVIADQWGEVAHVADAGEGHDLPDGKEIAGWVRYLAIQCPECQGEAL